MTSRIRPCRAKKALSPIIVAALLIVVFIGFISVAYLWFSVQQKAGNAIFIQNVNLVYSTLAVYVQNIGDGTVVLDSIFINEERFAVNPANCIVGSQNTTELEKGQTACVSLNNVFEGQLRIKVVCKDGTNTETNWKS